MAQVVREYRSSAPHRHYDDTVSGVNLAARVIYFIGGIIVGLLSLRFILSFLGANRGNTFASFIYDLSRPFVQPFFGLFNTTPRFGVVRFEIETLFAILFYGLLTWLLIRLVNIGNNRADYY